VIPAVDPSNGERPSRGILADRRRFILLVGVLGWGIPCAVLFAIALGLRRGAMHEWYFSWSFLGTLAAGLLLFSGGGVFFGAYLWERLTRRRGE
jgi:hypothetical protein